MAEGAEFSHVHAPSSAEMLQGSEKILIAEDNHMLRDMMANRLAELGCEGLQASNKIARNFCKSQKQAARARYRRCCAAPHRRPRDDTNAYESVAGSESPLHFRAYRPPQGLAFRCCLEMS